MHVGKIDGKRDTAARRVYRALLDNYPYPLSTRELNESADTPCASTRIAEVRRQLPVDEAIPPPKRVGNVWYYRLVRTRETAHD